MCAPSMSCERWPIHLRRWRQRSSKRQRQRQRQRLVGSFRKPLRRRISKEPASPTETEGAHPSYPWQKGGLTRSPAMSAGVSPPPLPLPPGLAVPGTSSQAVGPAGASQAESLPATRRYVVDLQPARKRTAHCRQCREPFEVGQVRAIPRQKASCKGGWFLHLDCTNGGLTDRDSLCGVEQLPADKQQELLQHATTQRFTVGAGADSSQQDPGTTEMAVDAGPDPPKTHRLDRAF